MFFKDIWKEDKMKVNESKWKLNESKYKLPERSMKEFTFVTVHEHSNFTFMNVRSCTCITWKLIIKFFAVFFLFCWFNI
jgi:hypothetical protein